VKKLKRFFHSGLTCACLLRGHQGEWGFTPGGGGGGILSGFKTSDGSFYFFAGGMSYFAFKGSFSQIRTYVLAMS